MQYRGVRPTSVLHFSTCSHFSAYYSRNKSRRQRVCFIVLSRCFPSYRGRNGRNGYGIVHVHGHVHGPPNSAEEPFFLVSPFPSYPAPLQTVESIPTTSDKIRLSQ